MKRILLTGMSGTGKSSVIRALAGLGYKAIDTDEGWCEQLPDGRQRWREDAITTLLATEGPDLLFVAGCEENQADARGLRAEQRLHHPVDDGPEKRDRAALRSCRKTIKEVGRADDFFIEVSMRDGRRPAWNPPARNGREGGPIRVQLGGRAQEIDQRPGRDELVVRTGFQRLDVRDRDDIARSPRRLYRRTIGHQ